MRPEDPVHGRAPQPDPSSERIGAAISVAAAGVTAPDALRERVATQRRGRAVRPRPARRALLPIGIAVAVAMALAVVLVTGGGGAPSLTEAAAASLRPATLAAPAVDPLDRRYVLRAVDGLRFPNYARVTRWRTAGARVDRVGGRTTTTVVYRHAGADVSYAIVSGTALAVPDGAHSYEHDGVRYAVLRRDGVTIVSWRRRGRTCILATRDVGAKALVRLAHAW